MAIKNCVRADGAPSRTKVVVRRRFTRAEGRFALLDVQPESGRKHQIRIHLAHAGFPIVGDKIYGGDPTIYLRFVEGRLSEADRTQLLLANHALHARAIELPGLDGLAERFETAPEPEFTSFCAV